MRCEGQLHSSYVRRIVEVHFDIIFAHNLPVSIAALLRMVMQKKGCMFVIHCNVAGVIAKCQVGEPKGTKHFPDQKYVRSIFLVISLADSGNGLTVTFNLCISLIYSYNFTNPKAAHLFLS